MIWYEDLTGFLRPDNYLEILPLEHMSIERRMNAIVRFFLYLGIILALLRQDYRFLFFGIIAGLISMILYEHERVQKAQAEHFLEKQQLDIVENKVCSRSTVANPFMNPSIADITDHPDRPPACNIENDRVQTVVENHFEARLFRDIGDLYGKMASQRQFYTVPATTIPNDQDGFARWCYGKGASCKEGNGRQCEKNLIDHVQERAGPGGAL